MSVASAQAAMARGALVGEALTDLAQDLHHRLGRRGSRALGARRGPHPPLGRLGLGRADDQVGPQGGQRQVGQQREAEPGGDVGLKHLVLVALEPDPRIEARLAARLLDHVAAGARAHPAQPRLVGEVGEPHRRRPSARGWSCGSARYIDSVKQQRPLDVALVGLGGEHRVVEDDREVDLRRAQLRQRLLGLRLGDAQAHARMPARRTRPAPR